MLTSVPRLAFAVTLASLLAASPLVAQAGSYATATVGNLGFQLIDLDSTDGVLPSYVLSTAGGNNTTASVYSSDGSLGWSDSAGKTRDQLFSNLSLDTSTGKAQAHAEVTSTSVSASGSAAGKGTSFNASAYTGQASSSYYYYGSYYAIDLSPHSVLVVTARANVDAWAGNPQCANTSGYYYSGCSNEFASGTAAMNLSYSYYGSGLSTNYAFNDSVNASANATYSYSYQYDPKTGYGSYVYTANPDQLNSSGKLLTAVFTNSSDQVQRATLGLSATVQGYATTAIPEAGTAAMFALGLLGLWGLGGQARRRP